MVYRKVELKFKIADIIKKDNLLHLWITSYGIALQDLIKTHRIMLLENNVTFYYFKLSVGFLKEALDLINSSLESEIAEHLLRNKKFNDRYSELNKLFKDDENYKLIKGIIEESRNKIFHYNQTNKDFKNIKKLLIELEQDSFRTSVTLSGEEHLETDYVLFEEIQLNQILAIIEKRTTSRELGEVLEPLSKVMVKVIFILESIVAEFINKLSPLSYLKVNYR